MLFSEGTIKKMVTSDIYDLGQIHMYFQRKLFIFTEPLSDSSPSVTVYQLVGKISY